MRMVLNISAVLLCGSLAGLSALAQSAPSRAASVSGSTSVARLLAADPSRIEAGHASGSVEAHFAAANTTHDGHLTRQQAELADWPRVARHFDEIDTEHRGWITAAEIHAFNRTHHKHRVA